MCDCTEPKWVQQIYEIKHSTIVLQGRQKWSLFIWALMHQYCQILVSYNTVQQHSSTSSICNAFKFLKYISTYWWPLLWPEKRSLEESLRFYSRQKLKSWDTLCQLQSMLNCRWAVQKGVFKVLLNFLCMSFHPPRPDDIRLVEHRKHCHKWHASKVDLRCYSVQW